MPKKKKASSKSTKPAATKTTTKKKREVVWDKPGCKLFIGDKAMTVAKAKELLGWEEQPEGVKWTENQPGLIPEISAFYGGKKICCHHNVNNRSIIISHLRTLMQEHLNGRWQFNGEPIIIGETGLILDGQHTLITLVCAGYAWRQRREAYPAWLDGEPTIQKVVTVGIKETDIVIDTMNTGKPRTLANVIERRPYFEKLTRKARKVVSTMLEHAIRQLWYRTGVGTAFNAGLRTTHAEFIDFLDRHPNLIDAVQHIYEENGDDNRIGRFVRPGQASGLLYLMGSAATDPTEYQASDPQSEKSLDWKLWDQACDFWALIAGDGKEVAALRKQMQVVLEDGPEGNRYPTDYTPAERIALVTKAWQTYSTGKTVTPKSIELEFEEVEGFRQLAECPSVGGIDLGDPKEYVAEHTVTEEEVERRKKEVKDKKQEAAKKASKLDRRMIKGAKVWVTPEDKKDKPYQAKLIKFVGDSVVIKVLPGYPGAGSKRSGPITSLSLDPPTSVKKDK